jgi:hypothetical protein
VTTKRALVCSPVMPAYDRESGSRRVFNLVEFLREAGWEVSFATEATVGLAGRATRVAFLAGGGRHLC